MRWIVSRERPEGWALPLPLLGDDVENRYEKAQGDALGQWFVPPLPKQGIEGVCLSYFTLTFTPLRM